MQPRGRDVRVGDQEREQAIAVLGEHMSAGRLDVVEYDQRCGQVAAARFVSELTPLFDDLPGSPPGFGQPATRRSALSTPNLVILIYGSIMLIPLAIVTRQFWLLAVLALGGVLWFTRRPK